MLPKLDPAAIARHPRTRRWTTRFAIFMAVVGVLGFLVVPPVLKWVVVSKLGEALHRDVAIESISFNPYTLTLQVAGASVRERGEGGPGAEVFGFDSLTVNAELASLAVAGIVVKEVELVGPRAHLVRLADNRYNISDLIAPSADKKPEEAAGLPRFSVSNIRIRGGRLDFDDQPEGVKHEISDIVLQIPFVSTLSYYTDTYVEPHFSANINGAPLALQGKSRPFAESHESELTLDLDNLQLARYFAYSPVELPVRVDSGALDSELRLRFLQAKDQPATLTLAGKLVLKEFKLAETAGAPLLAMKRLEVDLREVDLIKLAVGIDRIAIDSPEIDLRIDREGVLNWLALVPPETAESKPAAEKEGTSSPPRVTVAALTVSGGEVRGFDLSTGVEQRATLRDLRIEASNFDSAGETPMTMALSWKLDAGERAQIDEIAVRRATLDLKGRELRIGEYELSGARLKLVRGKDGAMRWFHAPLPRAIKAAQKAERKSAEAPWRITIDRMHLADDVLRFEDEFYSPKAVQSFVLNSLEVENLSSASDAETRLNAKLRVNQKGEAEISGALHLWQSQGSLQIALREIELLPLQPYFNELLNVAVTRGQVSAKGALSFARGKDGIGAGYKGDLTLGNFLSVDKANAADFLKWKSLYFGNMDVATAPLSVSVGEVALSDFYARLILSAEGKLNVLQVVRKDGKEAEKIPEKAPEKAEEKAAPAPPPVAEATPAKAALPVKIGKVTLQGGTISFTDNFVKPNYSANLTKVAGRVTGLSPVEGSTADLELRGSYDGVAPINIVAKLNPFAAKSYLDLDAEVKGVEMTGFSTYSGKYAGYEIERGKLSLFLKYKVDNNQLSADNRIFLDQLTFGDPVEIEGASRLPVKLAVSLLQNRRGEIDINLPISGSLDDPQFSVGGIIVKVILNLFAKALTSPFALIGSLFGGGEELSYVEFDYGYATISPKMRERVQTVAKILEDRPAVKIDLSGRIDAERDREGLKRALMERRVKAIRQEELVKQGTETGSVDEIQIPEKDYPRYLERAYKAEKFPKPRNMIGLVKELPVEEMEKLMMANMKADDEALRELAVQRAKAVGEWLTGEGKVAPERVFQLQPNLTAKEGPQNEKASEARVDFSLK